MPQLSDPDYKNRPKFRESDLRRHLINEIKADDKVLEEDSKDDPRFVMSADDLKKKGVEDFQLDYALRTISRLASTPGAAIAQARNPAQNSAQNSAQAAARKPGAK